MVQIPDATGRNSVIPKRYLGFLHRVLHMARMQNLTESTNGLAVRANTVCKGFGEGETRTEVLREVNFEARLGELLMPVGASVCRSPVWS